MAHLSGFGLENFRVFKDYTWFDFAPITILVGPNNSGKSSLIKALLLLKDNKENLSWLELTEGSHNLISFKRIIHNQSDKDAQNSDIVTFKIPFEHTNNDCLVLRYKLSSHSNSPELIYFDLLYPDGGSLQNEFKDKSLQEADFDSFAKTQKEYNDGKFMPHLDYFHHLPTTKSDDHFKAAEIGSYESYQRSSRFWTKWSERFGLKIGQTSLDELTGKSQITINGRLLSEVGTGIQQIIALLFFIADELPLTHEERDEIAKDGGYIFVLEEPEANLHPKFQSILADMLMEAKKAFNIQFIIETHSEYLIRKLQYLTAKGEVKPEDVVIYYFNDPNNVPAGEKQVKKITILEDGSLSDDFGPGFYDEAANLALSLFDLRKSRHN